MTTFTILVGFALMLFLPCALTVLSSRDDEGSVYSDPSDYSDRIGDPIARTRITQSLKTLAPPMVIDATDAAAKAPEPPVQREVVSQVTANRVHNKQQARILRNEMEALLAAAAAARAQADALAAHARLAAVRAEVADAEATEAEEAAAAAIEERHRAA